MATEDVVSLESLKTEVLQVAADKAQEYVRAASSRRVAPSANDLTALARLHESFPENPSDPREVIAWLHDIGSLATVATHSETRRRPYENSSPWGTATRTWWS